MESKVFFCQFGYGKGLVLYGAKFMPDDNVQIWLSDKHGRIADSTHTITVPALKGIYGVLPLSIQLSKYKDCAVVCELTK